MGGYGSGGHNRKRMCVDDYRRLDLAYLQRHNLLRSGTRSVIRWTNPHRGDASINLGSDGASVTLHYKTQPEGETAWSSVIDRFDMAYIAKPFGGTQVYLLCRRCKQRCRLIYLKDGRFACRDCHGLAHKTRQAAKRERPALKSQALRERLGGQLGLEDPIFRPKGMHQPTFARYQARIHAAEAEVWDETVGLLRRLHRIESGQDESVGKARFWQ